MDDNTPTMVGTFKAPEPIQPGMEIGRCVIEKLLGRGGMGAVYLAKHLTLDIPVAIKILELNNIKNQARLEARFLQEARLAARIRHPNVVSVMDVDHDEKRGVHYIVMEFVEGKTVGQMLKEGPIPIEQAVKITADVTDVLVETTAHNIVHRDIKPDNILITPSGRTKLADLGIAKDVEQNANELTCDNEVLGTPFYMSPEQFKSSATVDVRADIYSLGATLYCMLTGAPPYEGKTALEVIMKLCHEAVPNPCIINPRIPEPLGELTQLMMAKEPEKRPQKAPILLEQLRILTAQLPDLIKSSSPNRSAIGTADGSSQEGLSDAQRPKDDGGAADKSKALSKQREAEAGGPDDDVEFECPLWIPIEEFDRRHIGYITADALGYRGANRPPLIAGNIEVTESVLDMIHTNAHKLGEDGGQLTAIRLKKKRDTKVPQAAQIVSRGRTQDVFNGVAATFQSIREQITEMTGDLDKLFEENRDAALEQAKKVKIRITQEFRDQVESVIQAILANQNLATLFACLGQSNNEASEKALHCFMVGTKLLSKHYHVTPENLRRNKRILSFAMGFMFMDMGHIFVPSKMMKRNRRLMPEEFLEVKNILTENGADRKHIATMEATNDPRIFYKPYVQGRLRRELDKLRLVPGVDQVRPELLARINTFPDATPYLDEEFDLYEKHPALGADVFRGSGLMAVQTLDVIQHHHQLQDGSGFPRMQAEVSFEAQLAGAVDLFDDLVADRAGVDTKAYDVAFRSLESLCTSTGKGIKPRINPRIYDLFCACIQKYPVGSFIRIQGGTFHNCFGQIVYYTPYIMDRPAFVVIRNSKGKRLEKALLFRKEHYDGSFRIVGLPFTQDLSKKMLQP